MSRSVLTVLTAMVFRAMVAFAAAAAAAAVLFSFKAALFVAGAILCPTALLSTSAVSRGTRSGTAAASVATSGATFVLTSSRRAAKTFVLTTTKTATTCVEATATAEAAASMRVNEVK